MSNELKYTLDTSKEQYTLQKCKQLDNRPLVCKIYDRGQSYNLSNTTVELRAFKPDGTFVIQSDNINISGNTITVSPINVNIVRVPGVVKLELRLTKGGQSVSSFTFELVVLSSAIPNGTQESQNILTVIEQLNNTIANSNSTLSQVDKALDDLNNLITSGGAVSVTTYNVDKTNINNKVNNIVINVEDFGAIGDGVNWDTTAFQNAFQYAKDNGIKRIKANKGKTYRIGDVIQITQNCTEFDGDNCLIKWDKSSMYDAALDNNGWDYKFLRGIFHIEGSITGTIANVKGREYYYSNQVKFTVDSVSGFNVGDYVILKLQTGPTWDSYDDNSLQPKVEIISRIIQLENNFIYLEYNKLPYKFTNGSFTGSITKINVLDNISIKNIRLFDDSPFYNNNGDVSLDGNIKLISLVSSRYVTNLKIDNLYGENTKLPLILNEFVYNATVKNCELVTPSCIGGGEGYLNQNVGSCHIKISDCHAFQERHLVDFTSSAYGLVENCHSSSSKNATFICHGAYEHDITFKNCQGSFGFANSGTVFGKVGKNITLENCNGYLGANYVENLRIINSSISLLSGVYQANVENSDLIFQENINLSPIKRGNLSSYLKFKRCNIVWVNTANRLILDSYDNISIENCDLEKDKGALNGISIKNCGVVNVTSCIITDVEFRITGSIKNFLIEKSKIFLSDTSIYSLVNTVGLTSNIIITISKNNFYHGTANKSYYACKLFGDSTDTAGIKKTALIKENVFNGQFFLALATTNNVINYSDNVNIGQVNILENTVGGGNFVNQNNILN